MKYGLKLWSTNTDNFLQEAVRLFAEKSFDYIELYIVPDSTDSIKLWKQTNIPIALHAPHHMHKVNLAVEKCFDYNKEIFEQVDQFSTKLDAFYTVVHLGNSGHVDESIRQLQLFNVKHLVIENKPHIAPLDTSIICQGATIEEVRYALDKLRCKFCLDMGHAMCTANYFKIAPYDYVEKFMQFKPFVCHASDNDATSYLDAHYNIGNGTYDFSKLATITKRIPHCLLETKKNDMNSLEDFKQDVASLRGFYE